MAVTPTLPLDYVLQYSYIISFLGAIMFSVSSIVSVDPTTIIANKNVSVVVNAIIGVCGFVAFCFWYNIPNPVINNSLSNPNTIKKSISL